MALLLLLHMHVRAWTAARTVICVLTPRRWAALPWSFVICARSRTNDLASTRVAGWLP